MIIRFKKYIINLENTIKKLNIKTDNHIGQNEEEMINIEDRLFKYINKINEQILELKTNITFNNNEMLDLKDLYDKNNNIISKIKNDAELNIKISKNITDDIYSKITLVNQIINKDIISKFNDDTELNIKISKNITDDIYSKINLVNEIVNNDNKNNNKNDIIKIKNEIDLNQKLSKNITDDILNRINLLNKKIDDKHLLIKSDSNIDSVNQYNSYNQYNHQIYNELIFDINQLKILIPNLQYLININDANIAQINNNLIYRINMLEKEYKFIKINYFNIKEKIINTKKYMDNYIESKIKNVINKE
jgi:hypothetical protein